MNKLERAFVFACHAHEGMIRKGFNQNYIFHPVEVLSLASILTDDEDVLCAALLHDTVEDTNTAMEAIDKLKQEDDLGVKIVCLCDKVSNLRSFQLLCFDKGDDAWNSFNMKDPKKHYWYYSSILEALSELKDTPVYKEYDFLVHSIFDKYIREGL